MNREKVFVRVVVVISLLLCTFIGGMIAYFINKKDMTSVFTIGNIRISLTEPNYNSTEAGRITPNKTIDKDPTITNVGNNDAYIFAKLEVPYYSVTNRGTSVAEDTELFSILKSDDTTGPNNGWTQVSRIADVTNHKVTYVYAYTGSTEETMESVATNNSAVLFNKVKFANLKDYSELKNNQEDAIIETFNVNVEAYAIQKDLANDSGTQITTPSAVWELIQENY